MKPLVWKRHIDDIFSHWNTNRGEITHEEFTHLSSCHPPGVKRGFVKGEALRFLRANSSKTLFEEKIKTYKTHRSQALQQKQKENKRILPFVTQYHPSVPNLKEILMNKWHFIEKQPKLREIFKEPLLTSHKRGCSLKDIFVRAKLLLNKAKNTQVGVAQAYLHSFFTTINTNNRNLPGTLACNASYSISIFVMV